MSRSPLRALGAGIIDVVRAPLMLAGVALVTALLAAPFAATLHSRLQSSLSTQPQISLDDTEIDADWWMEFRKHAQGLERTFTPVVLGFAAALDAISGILDGRPIPLAVIGPLFLSTIAWAFLWGGILQRFRVGRIGVAGFVRAGARFFVPFVALAGVAAAINLLLYLIVHRLLFGPVHSALLAVTTTERQAFMMRVVLYLLFFSLIAAVSLVADYARVAAVSGGRTGVIELGRTSLAFVRAHLRPVVLLFVATGAIFVALTTAYGALEIVGGSAVGGWRAIAIGQAYVLVRLAIRLTFAASELRLFTANQAAAAE